MDSFRFRIVKAVNRRYEHSMTAKNARDLTRLLKLADKAGLYD